MSTVGIMILGLLKMWPVWVGLGVTFLSLGVMSYQEKKHKRHQTVLRNRKEYYTSTSTVV